MVPSRLPRCGFVPPRPRAAGLADRMSVPSVRRRGAAKAPRRRAKIIRMPAPEAVRRATAQAPARAAGRGNRAGDDRRQGSLRRFGSAGIAWPRTALPAQCDRIRLLDRVNAARQRAGVPPLAFSSPTDAGSIFPQLRYGGGQDYLAFDGPFGDTPVDRIRWRGWLIGNWMRNLHGGTTDAPDPAGRRRSRTWLADPRRPRQPSFGELAHTGIGDGPSGRRFLLYHSGFRPLTITCRRISHCFDASAAIQEAADPADLRYAHK